MIVSDFPILLVGNKYRSVPLPLTVLPALHLPFALYPYMCAPHPFFAPFYTAFRILFPPY